jgi:hypothetical protein
LAKSSRSLFRSNQSQATSSLSRSIFLCFSQPLSSRGRGSRSVGQQAARKRSQRFRKDRRKEKRGEERSESVIGPASNQASLSQLDSTPDRKKDNTRPVCRRAVPRHAMSLLRAARRSSVSEHDQARTWSVQSIKKSRLTGKPRCALSPSALRACVRCRVVLSLSLSFPTAAAAALTPHQASATGPSAC